MAKRLAAWRRERVPLDAIEEVVRHKTVPVHRHSYVYYLGGMTLFLFGMQVKSRYGSDGWTCQKAQPENGEQSVGGVFINESCRKTVQGRSITVERALYRRADQDAKSFVDKTSVLIQRSQG